MLGEPRGGERAVGLRLKMLLEVLDWLHDIEHRLGSASHRDADGNYVDRLVDIDIMAIDQWDGKQWQAVTVDHPRLQVPHPHLPDREFFLQPYHQLKKMHNAYFAAFGDGS